MVKFVYRCGIVGLTNIKQEALDSEYDNLQHCCAINIGKRVLRYICNIGALVDMPKPELWNVKHFADLGSHLTC